MSNPILYYQSEDESLMYYYNGSWFDATNLQPLIDPEIIDPIPIYEFPPVPYSSDPVFVQVGDNWLLLQTSRTGQIQKLAEKTDASGQRIITEVTSLVNPYGPQQGFSQDWFNHLVNLKISEIPLGLSTQ